MRYAMKPLYGTPRGSKKYIQCECRLHVSKYARKVRLLYVVAPASIHHIQFQSSRIMIWMRQQHNTVKPIDIEHRHIELCLVLNFPKIPVWAQCVSQLIYQTPPACCRIYWTFPLLPLLRHQATNFAVTMLKRVNKLLYCITKKQYQHSVNRASTWMSGMLRANTETICALCATRLQLPVVPAQWSP